MSKNNQASNEDLAVMIKEGLDNVDEKFENIDKRFDKVENRLENLERGQDEIKMKMAYVAWDIDVKELAKRVAKIEKQIGMKI